MKGGGRRLLFWAWLVLSLVWIGGVAYTCVGAWPSIPLDLSPNDPETRSAFGRAVTSHAVRCALLAALPPLLLAALGLLVARLVSR
jgi:hypothetical protein